jgi:hypothetical protein
MDNIKEIVKGVMGKLSREPDTETKIQLAWEEFLGEKNKEHALFSGIKNKTIFITIDSPARLHQFKSRKAALLRIFQKIDPEINEIKYRVGQT